MLRWGILGTSFISDTMAGAIGKSPVSRIQAVAGRDAGRLAAFAARHGVTRTYRDIAALLADPDVDVVYVGLPNHVHHEAVIAAAKAGKAVLCEKSLTTTLADAQALAGAVEDSGIFFMEGLMYLNHPLMARLGEILASGRLGALRAITGFYAADIWRVANPAGRGTLFNLGCYPVSLLHFVVQAACGPQAFAARQVMGLGNVAPDGNLLDAALTVRFSNGVLASLQCSDGYGLTHDFAVHGERASLRLPANPWLPQAGPSRIEIRDHDGTTEEIVVEADGDAFDYQLRTVEACLADGATRPPRPAPRLSDSLEILSMLVDWERHCRA
ncbi:Gfo/Idh/MocA family protein [Shinella sp.]|uniref:Gfo/Idh/MocA family protein n=1 Tax=Shinella sp. TaxID=1870904 RepID=UPI003F716138